MAAETSKPVPEPEKMSQIARSRGANQAGSTSERQPIRSEDLLQGGREVQILHAGDLYRLTLTRAGKLILHK